MPQGRYFLGLDFVIQWHGQVTLVIHAFRLGELMSIGTRRVSRAVLGSVVGAVSLSAYFCTYSGYFSPFENKVSTTCDEFNLSRLSVFNHRYPVPRDLKCFSELGPESKVTTKFSFRLSGCLIMVLQVSGPGHVKTYRDSSTHKMQDSCVRPLSNLFLTCLF